MAIKIYLQEPEDQGHKNLPIPVTGFRSILTRMTELNSNYNLNGGLAFSDIYSRMYFTEFSDWMLQKGNTTVFEEIKKGWFKNIKLFKVLKGEGSISVKTRLLSLKSGGSENNVRSKVLDHVTGEGSYG
jgi:hypothetical protein